MVSYVYKYVSELTIPALLSQLVGADSDSPVRSYASDDFYGMMDENEGFGEKLRVEGDRQTDTYGRIDVAMGRLPVETREQGDDIVDKIIRYATSPEDSDRGEWKTDCCRGDCGRATGKRYSHGAS